MTSIVLKAAQDTDSDRILAYLRRQQDSEPLTESQRLDVETVCREWLDVYRGEAVFAEIGGRPAGFAMCLPAAALSDFPDALYFGGIFVEPEFRRSGVGRAFMDWLTERARAHGRSRIVWCTLTKNVAARAFSGRLGAIARGERSVRSGAGIPYEVSLFELPVKEA